MKLVCIVAVFASLVVTEIWLLSGKSYALAAVIAVVLIVLGLASVPMVD